MRIKIDLHIEWLLLKFMQINDNEIGILIENQPNNTEWTYKETTSKIQFIYNFYAECLNQVQIWCEDYRVQPSTWWYSKHAMAYFTVLPF